MNSDEGKTPWIAVMSITVSLSVVLAGLVTVAELDIAPVSSARPPSREWFALSRDRALLLGVVAALGVSALTAGWSDLDRRRTTASGATIAATLLAAGWAALPVTLWSSQEVVRHASFALAATIPVALAHLVHSALDGRTEPPLTRTLAVGHRRAAWATAHLIVVALAVVHRLVDHPFLDPRCLEFCAPATPLVESAGLARLTGVALPTVATLITAFMVILAAMTLRRAAQRAARLVGLAAVLAAGVEMVWALGPVSSPVLGPIPYDMPDLLAARMVTHGVVAISVATVIVSDIRRRIRLREIAREIVAVTPPNTVREVLALRLDDPCARIDYAVEDARLWVDEDGAVVGDYGAPGQQMAVVSREGRPVARVRFAGTAHAADLEEALGPAAVLALEAERTRAELLMRLSALEDLRRRVVEESDAARRRAERDLHDGAQHLLLAATFAIQEGLQDARTRGDARAAERLGHALADVVGIAADLRAVAHGMYPVLLGDAGLVPALEGLARSSTARISIDADAVGRLDPSVELTVYQAVAVAVRGAEQEEVAISLRRRGGDLRLRVAGPRLPLQTLEPLRDRIAALGGTMETPVGSVVVEVPCA